MSIVSNAGPLIAFSRLGRLDLLFGLYEQIILPQAVFDEVTRDPELPGAVELNSSQHILVVPVQNQAEVEKLRYWLDRGESEAIVLASEIGATLLIDERRARSIAATIGVPLTGTIGILLEAKRAGAITDIRSWLDELIATGVRLSPRLYEEALRLAGEMP